MGKDCCLWKTYGTMCYKMYAANFPHGTDKYPQIEERLTSVTFWLWTSIFAILHIDFFFSNLVLQCKVYNVFEFNLSLQSSTFCYFIIIIIIIITIHLYSLLVFVINIVVLCLVSSYAQSADVMSIIITRQFSVIAVIIRHTLDVLL